MAERAPSYMRFANAMVLAGFGWLAILLELAPVDLRASATPSPDLLFCVSAFLVIRRPSSTPAALIVVLGLARDLIGGGPVGVGALSLMLAVEALRFHRDALIRSWAREFAAVALVAFAMIAAQVVALTLAFAPSPALDTLALGGVFTCFAYVALALLLRYLFRIKGEAAENLTLIGRVATGRGSGWRAAERGAGGRR